MAYYVHHTMCTIGSESKLVRGAGSDGVVGTDWEREEWGIFLGWSLEGRRWNGRGWRWLMSTLVCATTFLALSSSLFSLDLNQKKRWYRSNESL